MSSPERRKRRERRSTVLKGSEIEQEGKCRGSGSQLQLLEWVLHL